MIKLHTILFCLLFSICSLTGQNDWRITGKSIPALKQKIQPITPFFSGNLLAQMVVKNGQNRQVLAAPGAFPQWYSVEQLPFFCKMEVKMEKTFKFPVKFRLGEVQYVEKMEGKPYY